MADTRRKIGIRASNTQLRKIKKATGKRVCRQCLKDVSPPRRTFCSDACVHEWKIRNNNKYARDLIYLRDLGKCAKCGLDTRYLKIEWEDLVWKLKRAHKAFELTSEYKTWLKSHHMTHRESQHSMWHADHIVAVFEGGADGGLDNLRTLCIKCHKEVSKSQQKRIRDRNTKD